MPRIALRAALRQLVERQAVALAQRAQLRAEQPAGADLGVHAASSWRERFAFCTRRV
jgi:hypothetical protein